MKSVSEIVVRCSRVAFTWLFAALLFCASAYSSAPGQSQARVSARLSSGVVKLGSEVTLIATVENAAFSDVGKRQSFCTAHFADGSNHYGPQN